MNEFQSINIESISENVFQIIGNDWLLITAGKIDSFNTMTASWGGFGVLWNKNICFVFVRPGRYTFGFLEKSETFTLSFFKEKYKKILKYCGSHSGRNVDKMKETGLTPRETDYGSVYFNESRFFIECRKIYFQDLDPGNFLMPDIEKNYPNKDYHRMYVGEIISSHTR